MSIVRQNSQQAVAAIVKEHGSGVTVQCSGPIHKFSELVMGT